MTKETKTILLIDDEEMVVDIGGAMIRKLGYEVLTAGGSDEALSIYKGKKDQIDLVILDMIMPGVGGDETYDRLKKINPGIKVLLSSGFSLEDETRDLFKRGYDGFIQKPFDLETLSKQIKAILEP